MIIKPDSLVRVAVSDPTTLSLDGAAADSATVRPVIAESYDVELDGGLVLAVDSPDLARIDWKSGGETVATSYAEVVSRHYFGLDALRAYGDGQDEFGDLPEEELFMARQAATEVFERNARRSFVRRVGRTKDYGRDPLLSLDDNDAEEMLTDGYRLVSGCQCERTSFHETPCWVRYVYGLDVVPAQVSRAVLELAAYMLRPTNRPIGATGESSDAGYIHFTTAGQDGATDIPEVNAAIEQFGAGVRYVW